MLMATAPPTPTLGIFSAHGYCSDVPVAAATCEGEGRVVAVVVARSCRPLLTSLQRMVGPHRSNDDGAGCKI